VRDARTWLVLVALAGCAKAKSAEGPDASEGPADAAVADASDVDASDVDAPTFDAADVDAAPDAAPIDATVDAAPIDAMADAAPPDATVDAMVTVDARPDATLYDAMCTTQMVQLLVNPAFDSTPVGTGWVEIPTDPLYPLITSDDGILEDTAPYKAWTGGIDNADDILYQDVAVPVGTTALRLTGKYAVGTNETTSTPYDTSVITVRNTGNTVLETVFSISNGTVASSWTAIGKTFTGTYGGQTIRLYFESKNDAFPATETSFYYDTLALTATVVTCP
jgi:hypothetical protein